MMAGSTTPLGQAAGALSAAAAQPPRISTGTLPEAELVSRLLDEAHRRFASVEDGTVADYIPALASSDPAQFGLSIVGVHGARHSVGDTDVTFTIQSISKPFVFALMANELGHEKVRELLGVNNSGLPFDSVLAVELNPGRTANPMVNAGAIATTSLVPGADVAAKWEFVRAGLSRFAGRELALDEQVYASESHSNARNEGIARLLEGYGRIYSDPIEATDIYTRQCSLLVTTEDLAVMSATLADGGVNPITLERVIDEDSCKRTLAVLATAGLYERSGEWLYEVGLPAKSGVSGGIITVIPGKGGLASFSPPLDDAGNSVRGTLATAFLSTTLGLNVFASQPVPAADAPPITP
ncbi:MAG: glutaminase A [Microterricola sp.]